MNVNAAIIDQRLVQIAQELKPRLADELKVDDPVKQKSLAFVYLCVKTLLDLEQRLSATFRRGDLIEELAKIPLATLP